MKKVLSSFVAVATAATALFVLAPRASAADHTVSINDIIVSEGAGTATFTLTLSPAPVSNGGTTYKVKASTSNGTATTPADYSTTTGTVTWASGSSAATQSFSVPLVQDVSEEGSETFFVNLSAPTSSGCRGLNCTVPTIAIGDGSGTATITDDDASLSISDTTNATKSTDCPFTVVLSQPLTSQVRVTFTASGDTGQLGGATSGQLTFVPGDTSETLTLDVVKQKKRTGTVTVTLSGAIGATVSDGTGTCTIKKRRH